MYKLILFIFLGGGTGSLCRFYTGKLISTILKVPFPFGTLVSNILASTILGLSVYTFGERLDLNNNLRAFLVVGFCGGFSTFSTFSLETFQLLKDQMYLYAGLNILVSILSCLVVFFLLSKTFS